MSAPVWHPVLLLDLDWPTGRLRLHSGAGWFDFNGAQWGGVGRFGQVSPPGEAFGMSATPIALTLFGLPPEILDMAISPVRNRRGDLWIAAASAAQGATLVGAPYLFATGYVDAVRYTLRREGGELEHGLQVELGVGPSARSSATIAHSAEDQSAAWPQDTAGRWLIDAARRVEAMTWPET